MGAGPSGSRHPPGSARANARVRLYGSTEVPNGYISSGSAFLLAPQSQLLVPPRCRRFVHAGVVMRTLVPPLALSDKEEVPGSNPGSPIHRARRSSSSRTVERPLTSSLHAGASRSLRAPAYALAGKPAHLRGFPRTNHPLEKTIPLG